MHTRFGWWQAIARLLLLIGCGALIILVIDGPYFKVAEVTLTGIERTDPNAVMQAAGLDGQNILLLDLRAIEQSIDRLPTVKQAKVTRHLPNQVTIHIEERQPYAIWESRGNRFLVDSEGVAIAPAQGNEGLITIVDRSGTVRSVGERVDASILHLAASLAVRLHEELGIQVRSYWYAWPQGLTVEATAGWRIMFSNADDLDYKMAVLKGILQVIRQRNARFELIDLSSKDRPYYR